LCISLTILSDNLSNPQIELGVEHPLETSLELLRARYGDRAVDYVDAAVVRRELTYDDYIETRTLLSLQTTLTDYHDELIFKVYHQQTELWFRLALHELERAIRSLISTEPSISDAIDAVTRINRYFDVVTHSFSVLLDGLSSDEFLIYRRAFGSSSGFQSSQFRAIEILCGLEREASKEHGATKPKSAGDKMGEESATFYWERAARHLTTNEPTLTLLKFKEQHLDELNKLYESRKPFSLRLSFEHAVREATRSNVAAIELYGDLFQRGEGDQLRRLGEELVKLDDAIVLWKQMHLRVAAKHLKRAPRGTGETNWAEYLAKSIAEQRCFPELRTAFQAYQS
jgi:tryptophan 2,3-dioxygenase